MTKKLTIFSLVLVLVLSFTITAYAQDPVIEPCEPDENGMVTGTVVDYDETTNTVTIDLGEGELCTLSLDQEEIEDYGHPIVTLLGNYFGDNFELNDTQSVLDAFAANHEATQVCVVLTADETDDPSFYELSDDPACMNAEVTADNGDGTFALLFDDESTGTLVFGEGEEEAAGNLADALATLEEGIPVEFTLNEDGELMDRGEEVAMYHDDGFGFGVIVKVYGIAMATQEACEDSAPTVVEPTEGEAAPDEEPTEEDCGYEVSELFEQLESGELKLGHLIQEFKDEMPFKGVGHVRKAYLASMEDASADEGSEDATGICNARANGGNAFAKGKAQVDCGVTEETGDPDALQLDEGNGKGKGKNKNKPNKNKP